MTDPFSASVGAFTIGDLAIKIVKHIEKIKNKKKIIALIHNECSDLQMEFNMLTDEGRAPDSTKPALRNTIQKTENALQKVSEFTELKETNPVRRIRKSLQTREIENHLKALREIRLDLQRQAGLQVYSKCQEMLELLQIQVDTSRKDKDDLLKHDSERTETPVKPLSEEQALCKASETMLQASNTNELIHLETRHRASFSCIDDCRCPCHRPWNFAPSNLLRQLLGILFIRYRSLPVLVPKCDPECQRRSAATLKITYRFPMWSFARLGLFLSMKSGLLSPELRLYTTNVIPHEARLFHVVSCGDVESIAALLQANSASVRDIDHRDGRSALHTAVNMGRFDVCKFLYRQGADPQLLDYNGISPLSMLLEKSLGILHGQPMQIKKIHEILRLFEDKAGDDDDQWEAFNLSPLHMIVTGIKEDSDIATAIFVDPRCLNQRDSAGNSALLWAAKRGDSLAVSTLLRHGADPNLGDKAARTPLHYIGRCDDPSIALELIDHGANVHSKSIFGSTPLHFAAVQAGDTPILAQILLENDAELEEFNEQRRTVLSEAAKYDHVEIAKFLLQEGAKLNHESAELETPLMEAVMHNSHRCLSLFIHHDARYQGKNRGGNTIIHLAALSGDSKTAEILASRRMKEIDIYSPNACGDTVEKITSVRARHLLHDPNGWMAAMGMLCDSINRATALIEETTPDTDSDATSMDVFFDPSE